MNIKIHGGVIGKDPGRYGLCTTCANVETRESYNGDVLVLCKADHPPMRIAAPLVRCSLFRDFNQPGEWDLEKIAWVLSTDKKGEKIGFVKPKEER